MQIKHFLWILPFISFIFGYYLINRIFNTNEIEVPILIGQSIAQASKILSDKNLNLRIIAQKETNELQDGIVLEQTPISTKIKQNQSVYLIVSKKPKEFIMPDFQNQDYEDIEKIMKKNGIKNKVYYIDSSLKKNSCLCQFPLPDTTVQKDEKVILYLSSGNKKPKIFPNFKKMQLDEVLNFLKLNDLKASIVTNNYQEYNPELKYVIVDQRPLPGSILHLNEKLIVQLLVTLA